MADKVKVLVVDDDRVMVRTICDILKIKGYEAEPANTGEEALEKVKSQDPDCVLMDIRMPGIDGIDTLKMLKELSPNLPIIIMSAFASEEQTEAAMEQKAYTVLTKPIDIQLLLSFLTLLRKERRILIVDDDPVFCRTQKDLLQTGDADSLEILKDIRAKYPSKPVVLVTGYGNEMKESIEKGLRIGAYTCLYKPFATEEMIGIIKDITRGKLKEFLGEPF
jgi:DNA-binding NtrC family response regulator